jgi:hypothetical protein
MKSMAARLLGLGLLSPALCFGCHHPRQQVVNDYYWFPRASVNGGPAQIASAPRPGSSTTASASRSSYLPADPAAVNTQPVPYAQAARGSPYPQVPAHLTVPDPQVPAPVAKAPEAAKSSTFVLPADPPRPPQPEMAAAATPPSRPQPPIDPFPAGTFNGARPTPPVPAQPTIAPPPVPAPVPPPPVSPTAPVASAPVSPPAPAAPPPAPVPAPTPPTSGGFGHASDYSWLSGEIQLTHRGPRLRYAPLEEKDAYGGSVPLLADGHVDRLKDGQFVRVLGHLVNAGGRAAVPAYKVLAVETVSR